MEREAPLPPQPPPPPVLPPPPSLAATIELGEPGLATQHAPFSALGAGLVSAVVHLSVVVALAAMVAAKPSSQFLGCLEVGAPQEQTALSELDEVKLETVPLERPDAQQDPALAQEASEREAPVLDLPLADFSLLASGTGSRGAVSQMTSLASELQAMPDGMPAGGAEFYGIQAAGDRFVYVVDCSGSMDGVKWQAARRELLASLRRLTDYRSFFVILFDSSAHPMFGSDAVAAGLLPATEDNIVKCEAWLNGVTLGNNTSPYTSVRQALSLQPSAIFLLTDGEFVDPTSEYLKRTNVRREKGKRKPLVPVHTVGFFTVKSQELLKRIAKDNGGVYRFVADDKH